MSDYATLIRRIEALTEACYALEGEIWRRFQHALIDSPDTSAIAPPELPESDFDDPIPF